MHLTRENKTKIKLSPPRLEGTQTPLQPHSGIVRNPVPPASQWEYTAVGFLLVHFVIRSLEFAHATGLHCSGLVSIPSPKLLGVGAPCPHGDTRGCHQHALPGDKKGTGSSDSTKYI